MQSNCNLTRQNDIDRPKELHLDENTIITYKSTSDDDISPCEMNCKKVIDKPTFVKRLTMGLLKINDQESRPLGKICLRRHKFKLT
jgi:hypothetical protein